jgi:hypothetical protein
LADAISFICFNACVFSCYLPCSTRCFQPGQLLRTTSIPFSIIQQAGQRICHGQSAECGFVQFWANDFASNGTIEVMVSSTIPPTIMVQVANNILTLAWPAGHTGWQLQCQTNSLTGTWVNVSASSTTNQMTIPLDTDNGSVFFRLIYL